MDREWATAYLAGIAGGMGEVAVSYPLDTMKVRLQTGALGTPAASASARYWHSRAAAKGFFLRPNQRPSAVASAVAAMRHAGTFYNGVSVALARGALSGAVFFGINDSLLRLMGGSREQWRRPEYLLAAVGTGFVETMVYAPAETIKVQLQVGHYRSSIDCARGLGLRGLHMGWLSLLGSHCCANVGFFITYAALNEWTAEEAGGQPSLAALGLHGAAANAMYYLLGHPLDTVHTRMMAQRYPGELFRSNWHCARMLMASSGGLHGLMVGALPNVLQALPGGFATVTIYAGLMRWFGVASPLTS